MILSATSTVRPPDLGPNWWVYITIYSVQVQKSCQVSLDLMLSCNQNQLRTHLAWMGTVGGFQWRTLESSPVVCETIIRDSDIKEVACNDNVILSFLTHINTMDKRAKLSTVKQNNSVVSALRNTCILSYLSYCCWNDLCLVLALDLWWRFSPDWSWPTSDWIWRTGPTHTSCPQNHSDWRLEVTQ